MKASVLFVRCLEEEGIKYVFGVPGEETLDLLEAIRDSSLQFIITHDEQAAAFMAATVGRLTGKVGVALSTLGPGATNLATGVAYAQLGGMPLLVVTGQKPIRKSKQGRFQIVDTVGILRPITKMAATIVGADRIPSMVHEAVRVAEFERPGAVHLELPEDVAAEETDVIVIAAQKVRRPGPDPKAVAAAVAALERAKRPLILVASGANRKLVRKHLHVFIEKTGIPFVTTQMGKGVEDESSALYHGTAAVSDNDFVHAALTRADLVLVVGHDITEKPPVVLTQAHHEVIHINFYPATIDDVYVPTCEVVGDIAHSLWAIGEAIKPSTHWELDSFMKLREALLSDIAEQVNDESFPLKPQRFVHDLRSAVPQHGILSLDNGMYKIWIARNYPAFEQSSVLLDNALATMGAGLAGGIAAKLLHPERPVVVVTGDGGFMMSVAELETAKRLGLDLVVVIVDDEGYGMIRWKQEEMHFADFGLSFKNPDFVKLAESFGAHGTRISSAAAFAPAIEKAIVEGGIQLIDCPIDYTQNSLQFGDALNSKTKKFY
ncbi:acetolactate synthase large subunit [Candidatus Uhrbacteria bacterium CG10_big_fil_rev_8_21_14_0_10_48_11]|uniref:Acetolactate synthase large subunit n=1 Tax=Candidatus Uhrbacteria bacterium CG10_big_fil_rev_8_21_14_0_10_48_11 TaxID=1975037 RepID=A0A2M8LE20_9BACT|nr:MAG: acetolactate synthase large subunit [Candidatus Uhrbacteria bacterium CG10_big_fil_rev_8_21_14_0_10_48_11]